MYEPMGQLIRYSVLAPELDVPARRMLKVVMQKSGLTTHDVEFGATLEDCPTRHVLSVGKAALDTWHEFNCIGITAHHGNVFQHWDGGRLGHRVIMVLHHPGALMQLSMGGYEAKDQMLFDLARWRGVVSGEVKAEVLRQGDCGRCMMKRGKGQRRVRAEHWVEEVDRCGLCEDCYRGRGKITRRPKKRVNPSAREAQVEGQLEMIPDGLHVILAKS